MKNYNLNSVKWCIEDHLKKMFYRIPDVRAYQGKDTDTFCFKMETRDAKYISGATIKKWIKSDFDLTGLEIKASKRKDKGFGYGDYGYDFVVSISLKETIREDF